MTKLQDFFGSINGSDEESKSMKEKWQKFNIFKYKFR